VTRSNPTNPTDLPEPNLADLRTALLDGSALTCWRVGVMADPTQVALHGLNGQANRTGGAGWLHATCRLVAGQVMLLVGGGKGREPGWQVVGTLTGRTVTWAGIVNPNPVQVMRERLTCCLMRSLGFKVVTTYLDGDLLPTDRVLVGATCLREGCHRPLTTPESIRSGYGPTCGGRVKAPRTWANVNLAEAMAQRRK
jgi:hypothetical protein